MLRAFQNGVVHVYAAMMVVGLAAIGLVLRRAAPQRDRRSTRATTTTSSRRRPGVGYAYRWDADGDGKPDKPDFGADATLKLHVAPGKSQDVSLEVKNSFGLVRTKTIHVARPLEPTSSL